MHFGCTFYNCPGCERRKTRERVRKPVVPKPLSEAEQAHNSDLARRITDPFYVGNSHRHKVRGATTPDPGSSLLRGFEGL